MDRRIIYRLFRADHMLKIYLKNRVKQKGLNISANQTGILFLLGEKPMGMGELGAGLGIKNSAVTRIVDELSEKGLVDRHNTEPDRRRYTVVLTSEGKNYVTKLSKIAGQTSDLIRDGFTSDEIGIFIKVLESIGKKLK